MKLFAIVKNGANPATLLAAYSDKLESSIANMVQQLAQQERQYEYYRNKLMKFG